MEAKTKERTDDGSRLRVNPDDPEHLIDPEGERREKREQREREQADKAKRFAYPILAAPLAVIVALIVLNMATRTSTYLIAALGIVIVTTVAALWFGLRARFKPEGGVDLSEVKRFKPDEPAV
jgi:hypothetical protein